VMLNVLPYCARGWIKTSRSATSGSTIEVVNSVYASGKARRDGLAAPVHCAAPSGGNIRSQATAFQ